MVDIRKALVAWMAATLAGVVLFGGAVGCRREGAGGGFEYTAGWMSAELTGVLEEAQGSKQLEVPKKLGGKRVRSIAPKAFGRCTNAISVKIPWRVSRIGTEAFAECPNLVWVELPSRLTRVEEGLFRDCRRMEESDIPKRVEAIGEQAYRGCIRLKRVAIPEKLRSVGAYAFSGCSSLQELDLPVGVTEIGPHAFDGCKALGTFVLPPRIKAIPEGLFANCPGLGTVEMPDDVQIIDAGAFSRCSRLRMESIPECVTNIGERAFAECISLERIELPPGISNIPDGTFDGCSGLESVRIPEGVTNIGARAFAGCVLLERIELPPGISNMPDGMFDGCSGLKSVRIPEGVTNIGARAFAGCVSLERIELPKGLRSIGDDAFFQCILLETVAIPGGVEYLGERAFAGCSGLKSVELPEGLSSMGRECFLETDIESVVVPPGLAVLEEGVFSGCTALAKVVLSPGLESVRADAFRLCPVTTVSLPATVQSIHPAAYSACPGLDTVEVAAGNPVFSVRDGVLFRDGGAELVLFPRTRSGKYAVPEDVKRIGPYAFRGSMVEDVSVPDGVETIAESAFLDCRWMRRVAIGEGVKEIGDAAFAGCSSLWEFVMPAGIERTGESLFAGCDALLFLVLPDSLPGDLPPGEAWQVPGECSIHPRSVWEEVRKGGHPEAAVAPFYGLFTGEDLDTVAFEGTVLAASPIPDPAKNDYDDCLYALLVELESVQSTTSLSTNVERVVLVNVPVMEEQTIIQRNVFEPGEKIACTCASYDDMPQGILEIQLSDDIQSFEHQQYYPLEINRIPAFRETGNKDFAKREITVFPVKTLPKDENATALRRERMQKEIARIESELAKHGGSFEAWKEEYKPVAERYARLCEEGYAGWIRDSYFAAGGPETTYNTKAYIEGLLPYKKYLEANNIDLIVVRVPSKWDFAARVLASDDFRENPAWLEHYLECLRNDIEIIDPMPEMWKERFDFPLFYFYHDAEERHPCDGTAFVFGKEIANVLKRYPYTKTETEIVLKDVLFETDDPRFFWPGGHEKFAPSQNMVLKSAVQNNEPVAHFDICSGKPFLFLSNSFFLFPQQPLGASVPGYTAYFIQALPDWRYRGGIDNQLVAFLLEPHLLDSRRVVVMVGGFDAWTGFPTIPKYILDGVRRITLEKTIPASSAEITIDVHDAFSHSASDDGSVWFEANDKPSEQRVAYFDMGLSIPGVEGKHTVMVRVNIRQTAALAVELEEDGPGTVVDMVHLLPGRVTFADFFLPLEDKDTDVTLRFFPRHPEKGLFVTDVELWYY